MSRFWRDTIERCQDSGERHRDREVSGFWRDTETERCQNSGERHRDREVSEFWRETDREVSGI